MWLVNSPICKLRNSSKSIRKLVNKNRQSKNNQSKFIHCIPPEDINGRALMKMNDEKLKILGIDSPVHRYEIMKEIYKQVNCLLNLSNCRCYT